MVRLALAMVLVTALIGCGSDDEPAAVAAGDAEGGAVEARAAAGDADRGAVAARRGTKIKVVDSEFGRILANGKGQAVYLFDREEGRRSECYGECAKAWPPVLTNSRPRAGAGARARLLGTTRRRGGKRQVTYRGHPLYYYVDDAPGRVLCHDVEEFGGLWLVVKPNGRPAD